MKVGKLIMFTTIFTGALLTLNAQTPITLDTNPTKGKEKLELTVSLLGLTEGETVTIKRLVFDKQSELMDKAIVTNGKLYFQFHIDNAPQYFIISFSKHPSSFIALPLSNDKTFITSKFTLDVLPETNLVDFIIVDGSKTFSDWVYIGLGVGRFWFNANHAINVNLARVKDSILSGEKLDYIAGLLKAKQCLEYSAHGTLEKGKDRDIIPFYFRDLLPELQHSSFWPEIYNSLSQNIQTSYYGKWMNDRLPLCIGQKSPNFNFVSKDGTSTSLRDVVGKNKLTVLHFWSNGSVERTRIHSELGKAYNKYNSKGLEVISVSLDANPDKWKRVVQGDKIPGHQICDFKEEESPLALLYKMDPRNTINVLIDQDGKIVAWDVDGPAFFGHLYNIFDKQTNEYIAK